MILERLFVSTGKKKQQGYMYIYTMEIVPPGLFNPAFEPVSFHILQNNWGSPDMFCFYNKTTSIYVTINYQVSLWKILLKFQK